MLQTRIQIRKEEDYTLHPKPTKVSRKAPDVHKKALAAAERMKLLISISEQSALLVGDSFYTSQNYLSANTSSPSPLLMGGLTCRCGRHEFSTSSDLMSLLFTHLLVEKKHVTEAKMLFLGFWLSRNLALRLKSGSRYLVCAADPYFTTRIQEAES